jgi:hypothetical protein
LWYIPKKRTGCRILQMFSSDEAGFMAEVAVDSAVLSAVLVAGKRPWYPHSAFILPVPAGAKNSGNMWY